MPLVLMVSLFVAGCQKDPLSDRSEENQESANLVVTTPVQSRSTQQTVLGALRNNPFKKSTMEQAYSQLYQTAFVSLPTTHWYIKFSPQSHDELAELEAMDLILLDFPLEYEVIELGEYYHIPSGHNDFPELYGVVKPGFSSTIPFTVLEELYLDESDVELVRESFRLSGLADKIAELYPADIVGIASIDDENCTPGCPTYPCCLLNYDCIDSNAPSWCYAPDCVPGAPGWPNCAGSGPQNECGCPLSSNVRMPGGCVQVEDVELASFEGVRRISIIGWNGWFRFDRTQTSDQGCWQIPREYSGKAWIWARFDGERGRLRSAAQNFASLTQWYKTIVDFFGRFNGPNFNNIHVTYEVWTAQGSQAQRFWGAATVNNALHEFHDEASVDGITPPPYLDIYLSRARKDGFALMKNYLSPIQFAELFAAGLVNSDKYAGYVEDPGLRALIGASLALAQRFFPDVMIGTEFQNSDQLKRLAYHEFAHTSHFNQVGSAYWKDLGAAVIAADGWGDANSLNAGLISVCESWAEHLAMAYAHRNYGNNNSLIFDPNYQELAENRDIVSPGHVPWGLYHDMIDVGETNVLINDAVSGFTNAQMFGAFTPLTFNMDIYRSAIINGPLPATANTVAQVNALFDSYE